MTEKQLKAQWKQIRSASNADFPATTATLVLAFICEEPNCGPAWMILGSSLVKMGRYNEALEALNKALEICPIDKKWLIYAEIGHLYKARGEYNTAKIWYKKVIEDNSYDATGYIYLTCTCAKAGYLEEALAACIVATQCQEGCIDEAYLNLGYILRALGRHTESRDAFIEALRRDPKYKQAKQGLRDINRTIKLLGRHINETSHSNSVTL